jgi:predicted lactoylglutathione lyase
LTQNIEIDNNGGPGYRDYWPGYYAAFLLDPDGNNIEAVWYDYSKVK